MIRNYKASRTASARNGIVLMVLLAFIAPAAVAKDASKSKPSKDDRVIERQILISAPLDDVWEAWTKPEIARAFLGGADRLTLKVGEPFLVRLPESSATAAVRGRMKKSDFSSKLLSFLPERMLSFDWRCPPSMTPEPSVVVVEFLELAPKRVLVKITHHDFKTVADWSALEQERLLITPLSRFRQGTPIRLEEGILFTTYATLRSAENPTPQEQAKIQEHFGYLIRLRDAGQLILAGPCTDGAVGIVVFRAGDQNEARQIMLDDPAVKADVFTAELPPFHVSLLATQNR